MCIAIIASGRRQAAATTAYRSLHSVAELYIAAFVSSDIGYLNDAAEISAILSTGRVWFDKFQD